MMISNILDKIITAAMVYSFDLRIGEDGRGLERICSLPLAQGVFGEDGYLFF